MQDGTTPGRCLRPTEALVVDELYRLQLLSTSQIHQLFDADSTLRWTQARLRRLEREGWLQRVRTSPPEGQSIWFLTKAAHRTAAESKANRSRPRPQMTAMRATNSRSRHLLLSNQVGIVFTENARRAADTDTCTSYSWDIEVRHPFGSGRTDAVITDVVLRYQHRTRNQTYAPIALIELDRGTESVPRLVEKLKGYARFRKYRTPSRGQRTGFEHAWMNMYPAWPTIIFVFADLRPAALDRRMRLLFDQSWSSLQPGSHDFPVLMTSLEALETNGPLAPIFCDLRDGDDKAWDRTDAAWVKYEPPPGNNLW